MSPALEIPVGYDLIGANGIKSLFLLATKEWAKVWVFRLLVVILAEIVQLLHRFGVVRL